AHTEISEELGARSIGELLRIVTSTIRMQRKLIVIAGSPSEQLLVNWFLRSGRAICRTVSLEAFSADFDPQALARLLKRITEPGDLVIFCPASTAREELICCAAASSDREGTVLALGAAD